MNQPRPDIMVSVILTTFNGEKYLVQQLDSIIQQTHKNLEIIICDDASTDQTVHIIKHYATEDKRITLLLHTKNIGLNANLEAGLHMAKGDFIAISDQDDIWRTDKIEKLLGCIGSHIGAFSDSELIKADGRQSGKTVLQAIGTKDVAAAVHPLRLVGKNVVSGHTLLFKKSLLSYALPFCKQLVFDHQLAIVASLHGGLAYFHEPLVRHRIHGNNYNNSSMLDGAATKEVRRTNRATANERILQRRAQYDATLAALEISLSNSRSIEHIDAGFLEDIYLVISAMRANQHRFFDFRLFFALRRFDKKYHFFSARKRNKLCKGLLWYKFSDKVGLR